MDVRVLQVAWEPGILCQKEHSWGMEDSKGNGLKLIKALALAQESG